jgi:hypothetical protein
MPWCECSRIMRALSRRNRAFKDSPSRGKLAEVTMTRIGSGSSPGASDSAIRRFRASDPR